MHRPLLDGIRKEAYFGAYNRGKHGEDIGGSALRYALIGGLAAALGGGVAGGRGGAMIGALAGLGGGAIVGATEHGIGTLGDKRRKR